MSVSHAVRSSKSYEDEGVFDIWTALPVEIEWVTETTYAPLYSNDTEDSGVLVIPAPQPKSRWKRLKAAWHGEESLLMVSEQTAVLRAEGVELVPDEEASRINRAWTLQGENNGAVKKNPTPREQGMEADELVAKYPREHNPELIEAIKHLPSASELLLKFPRELTNEEKRAINRIARGIVSGKPTTVKITV